MTDFIFHHFVCIFFFYDQKIDTNGMCEALRELMKDEIEQDVARGEARGEMRMLPDRFC